MVPSLTTYIEGLLKELDALPPARKNRLERLATYLRASEPGVPQLVFVCTHNSRRSQIAQVWAAVAAAYYGIDLRTYSGGTETTAFNPRAVAALRRAGFTIDDAPGENPHYRVTYADRLPALACWSKTYDDPANPVRDFAAIMTCAEADADCPFIPGAALRLSLTYEDPKEADGTEQEAARYDERVRQIGTEVFYAMRSAKAEPPPGDEDRYPRTLYL